MDNNDEVIIEEKSQDTVEVPEDKTEDVDLSKVEVMSNGQQVNIQTDEAPKAEGTEEQPPAATENKTEDTDAGKEYQQTKTDIEEAKKELTDKGIDYAQMEKEYLDKGELSEQSLKALKDAGYSEAIIKATLAGWQANVDKFVNTVVTYAGGQDTYNKMTTFVKSMGDNAVTAYNAIMETGELNTVKAYIDGIKAQMVAKYGTSNPSLMGSSAKTEQGFSSWDAVTKAMSDPRYGRNAAYTKAVEDKLAKSNF